MRVKLQLVICDDDGQEETVTDVVTLQKDSRRLEHLGLTLAEAKQLLKSIQHRVLQRQVDTFLDACSTCKDCGTHQARRPENPTYITVSGQNGLTINGETAGVR